MWILNNHRTAGKIAKDLRVAVKVKVSVFKRRRVERLRAKPLNVTPRATCAASVANHWGS